MYKCDICGKKAKYNLQNTNRLYLIVGKEEGFVLDDEWDGDRNEFFCEDCWQKQF